MLPGEFITSDHHFSHFAVIKYSNRPFSSVYEMDKELIARWNNKVPPNAVVYHLGDFAFCRAPNILAILHKLNGRIRLVLGNHDKQIKGEVLKKFEWVKQYYESKTEDNRTIVMFHYPLLTWNKAHYGSWHFAGHSHGNLKDTGTTRIDIGVDTHPNYEPYSYEEILDKMSGRVYKPVDHHRKSNKDDEE